MVCRRRVISPPEYVYDNLDSMEQIMKTCGFKISNIVQGTGISYKNVHKYVKGYVYATKTNYNKLAEFFDWEEWE